MLFSLFCDNEQEMNPMLGRTRNGFGSAWHSFLVRRNKRVKSSIGPHPGCERELAYTDPLVGPEGPEGPGSSRPLVGPEGPEGSVN